MQCLVSLSLFLEGFLDKRDEYSIFYYSRGKFVMIDCFGIVTQRCFCFSSAKDDGGIEYAN